MRLALLLVGRRPAADRPVALLLAVVTAAAALFAAGSTALVDDVRARGLRAALVDAPAASRDVVAASTAGVAAGPAADPAAPYDALVAAVAQVAGGPLDAARPPGGPPLTGAPSWQFQTALLEDVSAVTGPRLRRRVGLRAGAAWVDRVRVVEGRLPGPARGGAVEVVLSAATARALQVAVGDTWQADPLPPVTDIPRLRLQLVGTVEPLDPDELFWGGDALALRPKVFNSDSLGTVWTGVAFTGPASLPGLARLLAATRVTVVVRLPVDPVAAAGVDPARLVAAVRRATSRSAPYAGPPGPSGRADPVLFLPTSRLDDVVVDHLRARRPVDALAGLLLVTLLAAAAIVLLLAARLLLDRRRDAVALARARGASGGQVIGALAAEALALAVPAALAGGAAALLLPGDPGVRGGLLVAAAALVPAAAVAGAAVPLVRDRSGTAGAASGAGAGGAAVAAVGAMGAMGTGGAIGAGGTARAARLARHVPRAGLVLLVALAVLAVVALRRRGLDVAAAGPAAAGPAPLPAGGADPLVVAAPALVAVVVALLAARLVAVPLALTARAAARRRGAVAFLGLARARRDGGGALVTVCLSLCLAVCVLAAATGRTVADATARSAADAVAAPLRVHSIGFPDEALPALRGLPGVTAVAPLVEVGNGAYTPQRDDGSAPAERLATVFGTDPAALAQVQAALPAGAPGVRVLASQEAARLAATDPPAPLPFAVGAATARTAPLGTRLSVRLGARRVDGVVAVVAPRLAGMPVTGEWLLAPLDGLRERTVLVLSPQDLLAAGSPLPTTDVVTAQVPEAVTVRRPGEAAAAVTGAPLAQAVRSALPRTLAAGALLAVAAVLLALLLGARARARFVAHLRALGLSARQTSALVVLEVAPVVAGALLGGLVGGVLLARLVLPAADLRPLVGSPLQPPPVLPAGSLAALAAGFVVVVAVGVAVAVRTGRAGSPAQAARTVEGS